MNHDPIDVSALDTGTGQPPPRLRPPRQRPPSFTVILLVFALLAVSSLHTGWALAEPVPAFPEKGAAQDGGETEPAPLGDTSGMVTARDQASLASTALGFADQLLRWNDPFNALTWYRLALFMEPESAQADMIRFKIAFSYEAGERWDAAEVAYGKVAGAELAPWAAYRVAVVNLRAKRFNVADQAFEGVTLYWPGTSWSQMASFARGVVMLESEELDAAAQRFSMVPSQDEPWASRARAVVERCQEPLPGRLPGLAAVMSTALPGSGQVYSGHLGDGVMAFLANGVLGSWSYTLIRNGIEQEKEWQVGMGATIGSMFLLTWVSNIHGAWRSARRFNDMQTRRQAASLLSQVYDPALQLNASDVILP